MRVADALALARARGLDRLDAQLLLAHLLQRGRAWLLAHDDDHLADDSARRFVELMGRRRAGEPLAYLTGEREFHGLSLQVSAAVLVPRPETEHLVDWALECLADLDAPRVVDLGTGSGAVALALAHARPDAQVLATDVSAEALDVARANAARLAPALQLAQGSWWQATDDAVFDLAVSNPPYIAGDDPHLVALQHEPSCALTPGGNGLSALEQIIDGARAHLRSGAWLLLEHGHDQGAAVRQRLAAAGFGSVSTRRDLAGHERCSGGQVPSTAKPPASERS